ncbi:MAG: fumarylacetoacetate hydrolase family protein [Desulfuromonadales bacterium]|nr:fumarylacetoacetate hydrolase family protein [Desulfuromonadales bacterium]
MPLALPLSQVLPDDHGLARLIGRVWLPGQHSGPAVVMIRDHQVLDISNHAATVSALLENKELLKNLPDCAGTLIGDVERILANSAAEQRDETIPYFLAPVDLQAIKACGVTFVVSMLERVIEEKAQGDPKAAESIRKTIKDEIGGDLASVRPGSAAAEKLKQILIARGMWSQYLEVGIGPYAEIFTKAQPMSAVGIGAEIGIHPESTWNNPEPEVVLVVDSNGDIVGVTLGNDVNLRDFEGRSALLLGRAKDNNASTALGPFIRLLDENFTLDDIRQLELTLKVEGDDGFVLSDGSSMTKISRDPSDLVKQTISRNHQYPDGLVLFTGTLFAPTYDRDTPGMGFTHKVGDVVTISTPRLGSLINRVNLTVDAPAWTFGAGKLMENLARRGLL